MKHTFYFEWKLFLRSRVTRVSLLLFFLIGLYSIYYGHSFQQSQCRIIHTLDTAYQARVQKQVDGFTADTLTKEGKAAYKTSQDAFLTEWATRPMVWKIPSPLQAMSIGQSDNQPYYYALWVYNNVYTSKQVELRNPEKLLAGNFDLSFTFLYILPLLVISFCYSLLSHDKEKGIHSLLQTQGVSLHRLLIHRLVPRAATLLFVVALLSTVGFLLNQVSGLSLIASWLLIAMAYLFCWFCIAYFFIRLQRNSTITALFLISTWVLFLLVIPSLLNNTGAQKNSEQTNLADADRDFSGYLWGMKKAALIDTLLSVRPDWRKHPITDTNEARSIGYSYLNKANLDKVGGLIDSNILAEQQRVNRFNYINPAYTAQNAFNQLSETEINHYTQFRKAAANYQLQRGNRLTEFRLSGKPFTIQQYNTYPVFQQPSPNGVLLSSLKNIIPVLLLAVLFILGGLFNWRSSSFSFNAFN